MERNCNQMSGMQRNGRHPGNMNGCRGMNGNPAAGNCGNGFAREGNSFRGGCNTGCGQERNQAPGRSGRGMNMPSENCGHGRGVTGNVRNDKGRGVEVECVCNVKPSCHREDPMEVLGCRFPLVMAYVPWQQWGEMYDADCGLMQGTIFKDLNKIFCGERC